MGRHVRSGAPYPRDRRRQTARADPVDPALGAGLRGPHRNVDPPRAQALRLPRGKLTRREIAGARAWCFRYTYEAEGIPMYAESCTIKRGGDLIWLHLYAREERREESFAVWETILSSAGRRADTSA